MKFKFSPGVIVGAVLAVLVAGDIWVTLQRERIAAANSVIIHRMEANQRTIIDRCAPRPERQD